MINTRALAIKSIIDIIDNKYTLLTLDHKLSKLDISSANKSFTKLLCYHFFRYYFSLKKIISEYVKSKTKNKVKIVLMLGLLQIIKINQPIYANINETVDACNNLKLVWAKKLVNSVLRNILRNINHIKIKFNNYSKIDLPEWLIDNIKQQYSQNYSQIISNINNQADMFIRLNQLKNNEQVLKYFKDNNISYSFTELNNSIKLHKPIDVRNNDLFSKGYFTVQDLSAQYAARIINPQNKDNILDACAAPGGKTTHIYELNPNTKITAIDIIDTRLNLLKINLNRFKKTNDVTILKHDLTKPLNTQFTKIILDVPCSATGTLRRNPDIKVLRSTQDIIKIQKIQKIILQNLWSNNLVKHGYMLYITCSILRQENQNQILSFIEKNKDAEIIKIDILSKYKTDCGYQLLPEQDKGDGFYYCLLKKNE